MNLQCKDNTKIPAFLISIFLFLSMLESFLSTSSMGTLLKYYQIVCLGIMFVIIFRSSSATLWYNNMTLLLVVIAIYLGISLIWSDSFSRGIMVFRSCFLQIVFIIIAIQFQYSEKTFNNMQLAIILGGVVLAILILVNGQTYSNYVDRFSISVDSETALDPNNLGGLLVISFSLLFPMKFDGILRNVFKGAGLILILIAMFLTGSRGAVLSCVGAVLVIVLMQENIRRKVKYILIAILVTFALVFISQRTGLNFLDNILGRFQEEGGSGRVDIWTATIPAVFDRTIFGVGLGGSVNVVKNYYGTSIGTHNTFLTLTIEGGVVLILMFLMLFIGFFKNLINKRLIGVAACETASLICSFFLDTYNKKLFWVPILLCFIAMQVKNQENSVLSIEEAE